jgi:small conductance mechanosensitive channel
MLDQLPPVLRDQIDVLLPQIMEGGLNLVTAILILILGLWFAGRCRVWTMRGLDRIPAFDDMLKSFFGTLVRYLIIMFTVLAVLAKFGVQTASLIAVLGAAGLAVGLALQGTLSNVAAGVMLLIFRPFRAGHFVEAGGVSGTVKALTLFTTELATPDNTQIIVPNSDVWGKPITNFSFHPIRRVEIIIGISYGDDIGKAIEIIRREIGADERCLKEPEPFIGVASLGDSSVNITTRVWTQTANFWPLRFDMTRRIKEAFDAGGITIPFPVRTIYTAKAE